MSTDTKESKPMTDADFHEVQEWGSDNGGIFIVSPQAYPTAEAAYKAISECESYRTYHFEPDELEDHPGALTKSAVWHGEVLKTTGYWDAGDYADFFTDKPSELFREGTISGPVEVWCLVVD